MSLMLITDSASDMSKEFAKECGIPVLPLTCTVDGKDYLDGVEITSKELMDKMRKGSVTKTSQINVDVYEDVFEKYAKAGKKVLYIAFSSALSGTYNAANVARETILEKYPDADITIIDSKCASFGLGLAVYKTHLLIKDKVPDDEVIKKAQYYCDNMEHVFTVDNLEYLFRGGRVSRTSAILGTILNIKPVLHVDDEGRLIPLEKARGRKASLKRLVELVGERGKDLENQTIGIIHGDDIDAVNYVKELIHSKYGCNSFVIQEIGGVVGAHAGPGTIAIFFLS